MTDNCQQKWADKLARAEAQHGERLAELRRRKANLDNKPWWLTTGQYADQIQSQIRAIIDAA